MQPLLEQVPWMASPPLAPDQLPDLSSTEPQERPSIDRAHLRRMTLGEAALEREVLAMFTVQTSALLGRFAAMPAEAAALAHTLKGSACAIGAFGVGEAAQALEEAIRARSGVVRAMQGLVRAVDETQAAIDAILLEIKP